MLGTSDMHIIVRHVTEAGAKLVLAGDPAQLQPIAAGAPLRAIIETVGFHELTGIIRQRNLAMRTATAHFARGRMMEGLGHYKRIGAMTTVETTDQAVHELVLGYLATYDPSAGTQIALAYTNAAVDRINTNIRSALQHTGKLPHDHSFDTADGSRMFSAGDRVLFNETKRVVLASGRAIQLDRGALATVEAAAINQVTLALDSGTSIILTPDVYNALTHGYAATFHKSQGVTVDRTFVLVTPNIDRHMAYVGFSRHRSTLRIYAGQSAFRDTSIEAALARGAPHVNALDSVERYLERRGMTTPATLAHRLQSRLLAARLRLTVAWKAVCARSIAVAQCHREDAPPPIDDAHASAVAKTLRSEIYELGISAKHDHIAVADPKDAASRAALVAAGGREVQSNSRAYYAFAAPDTASGVAELIRQFRRIERGVPPVKRSAAQVLPSPAGYRLTAAGMVLTIETASLPQTAAILERIQPRRTSSGALDVRMDIQDPLVVKETLQKLGMYHQTILVPPYSPSSGIDLPRATVDAVLAMTADHLLHDRGRAIARPVTRMIEAHFGSLDAAGRTSDRDATAVVATVARHIEWMQRVLEPKIAPAAHEISVSR